LKPESQTATCICGTVKLTANEVNPKFSVCHCDSCRAWGGGPFFAVKCGTNVEIEGTQHIKMYESSSWASRGFCINCGTHLFYKFKETGEYNMPLGLFPNLKDLEMDIQYFTDQRPNCYSFTNKTKEMTKKEIIKYFSSSI
jgi:hypothetical protein